MKEDEIDGACSTHEGVQKCIQCFGGNMKVRKRLLWKPRRRWEDNIRMVLTVIEWEGVDWMHLAYDRDQWRILV